MNLFEFIYSVQCGEEIDFSLNAQQYFLQPDYDLFNENWDKNNPAYSKFVIYNCTDNENQKEVFHGTIAEMENFKFEDKYTFREDFEKFKF